MLYLPEGKPPFPGVLVPCGHSANGKAEDTYQRICILLAKNGMAALCYDPIGQGERIQKLDADGQAGHPRGIDDRAHLGGHRALWSAVRLRLTGSGTGSGRSITWPAGRRSTRPAWAARAIRVAAR